jgi:phosphate-selective porin OprO/OprP
VWNATGETWGYKGGTPTTPLPSNPGRGMWQLGLRYDTMDLDDGRVDPSGPAPVVDGILGGKMSTWTVGANLYWRSNFKFMLDYVKVDSSRYSNTALATLDDNPGILEARAQFYW